MKLSIRFIVLAVFAISVFVLPKIYLNNVTANAEDELSFAKREEAYRSNNIGVAKLEQYNHKDAVEDFRKALKIHPKLKIAQVNLAIALLFAQENVEALKEAKIAAEIAPKMPQTSYILGLIAKSEGRTDDAFKHFQKVFEMDKQDVGTNVNLGQIYIQKRNYKEAETYLRRALDAEPYNSTALYNLATTLIRTKARDEGKQLMVRFQKLRKSGAATSIGQKYLEQGRYSEALVSTGAESELVDKTEPKVTFQKAEIGLQKSTAKLDSNLNKTATLFDLENDGDLDLVEIVNNQANIYRNENGKFVIVKESLIELNILNKTKVHGVVAGDFDNDLFADLLMFGEGQVLLFKNDGKGKFEDVTEKAKVPNLSGKSITGAFLDADHDGDLDIFLGGLKSANNENATNSLFRNNGDGTFLDVSETAKINLPSNAIAVIPTDYDNRRDIDLLVLNKSAKPNLYRNLRDGTFKDVAEEVGLDKVGEWSSATAGDFNKDSFTDFFFGRQNDVGVFAVSDGQGSFILKDAPKGTENSTASQFIDYDSDGLLDLLTVNENGFAIIRNLGEKWVETDNSLFKDTNNKYSKNSKQILSGDIDVDGDLDLLIFNKNNSLEYIENVNKTGNNSQIFNIQGRVSNRSGTGAKIDMRAGSLTQKLESYSASPNPAPADIHFGLGKREKPDAVRIIWTSGVVQAEIEFPDKPKNQTAKSFSPTKIQELDRKPSSCPYIYTWNGKEFEFVTDFLGGGEMGNWKSEGVYHYPDSDEYIRITSDQLKPKDGKYEIRVTNELEEVLFLDKLKLIAVEHDADREVYPNEGLGIPTAGKKILYTTRNEKAPISAVDTEGKDILPKIKKLDRVFYDNFKHQNVRGYAEKHNFTLKLDNKKDFNGRTLLLLSGWTDYAFSSDNLAASQSGRRLFLPKLQVKNKQGEWQTVIESIGISIGRPQTLVVDLTGKFLTDSREVRIVTNFKTYWDKIAVDTSEQVEVKTKELKTMRADLRERGFSEEIKYGEMIAANYEKVLNDGRWKYFSGNFTKTGAVNKLLNKVDDVFVISKTGDELVLSFDAMPNPPKGKKYTFLLFADGYSKEMDINSGSPDAVFPYPFKKMTDYPYGVNEIFPMDEEKSRIYDEYTTRIVKGYVPSVESYLIK